LAGSGPGSSPGRRRGEGGAEIAPFGIGVLDQLDLPFAAPALELLFAGDGFFDGRVFLDVDEAVYAVAEAELRAAAVAVFPQALVDVGGDAV
jgi:hypothetical protein